MILYKLIDEQLKGDIEKNKRISLNRPLIEEWTFEGEIFSFFNDIVDLAKKQENITKIKPTTKIIDSIRIVVNSYRESYQEIFHEPIQDCDIRTDFMIFLGLYFQHYCGYFTYLNLSNERLLRKYIRNNYPFIKSTNKKYLLKVTLPLKEFDQKVSIYEMNEDVCGDYVFTHNVKAKEFNNNILGYVSLHKIKYLDEGIFARRIFDVFNKNGRKISLLLLHLNGRLKKQNEERIMIHISDYKKNSFTITPSRQFEYPPCHSIEEFIFYHSLNIYKYSIKDHFPRYVYIDIGNSYSIKSIEDVISNPNYESKQVK